MKISASVYFAIKQSIGIYPPETGGILGQKNGVVCAFQFDGFGSTFMYSPKINLLNEKLIDWNKRGISFAGIVHSHPNRIDFLSFEDKEYIKQILYANIHLLYRSSVYFPIVLPYESNFPYIINGFKASFSNENISIDSDCIIISTTIL